jgi:hypothetical protein
LAGFFWRRAAAADGPPRVQLTLIAAASPIASTTPRTIMATARLLRPPEPLFLLRPGHAVVCAREADCTEKPSPAWVLRKANGKLEPGGSTTNEESEPQVGDATLVKRVENSLLLLNELSLLRDLRLQCGHDGRLRRQLCVHG